MKNIMLDVATRASRDHAEANSQLAMSLGS